MTRILLALILCGQAGANSITGISAVGQSLSVGLCVAGGLNPCTGVLSTTQYGSNKQSSPVAGSNPGTALTNLVSGAAETPITGAINQITYESGGAFVGMKEINDSASGANYNSLKKGTSAYTNWKTAMTNAPAAAAAAGYSSFLCGGALVVHGEADFSGFGVSAATYAGNLAQWHSDMATDCGGGTEFPFFVSQLSAWWTGSGANMKDAPVMFDGSRGVPLGQLDAARANMGKIYLVGPKYQWWRNFTSGLPHMTEGGYLRVGEQAGHAMKTVLVDGKYWTGVQPRSIRISGATITARYWVQEGALVFDTSTLPDRLTGAGPYDVWHGFEVVNGSGATVQITGGSIAGDTVTINLASTPTGTPRLRYAWTNPHDVSATNDAAWGNLRDSTTAVGRLSHERLYSWAVTSDDPIPFTSPDFISTRKTLLALNAAPSNLTSNGSTTLTATLDGPAGAGGQDIALTYSDSTNLSAAPAVLTVLPDQTTGRATITAGSLAKSAIVTVTGADGVSVNLALNAPYTPSYPVKVCFMAPVNGGSCADPSYNRVTTPIVDRYLTVQTGAGYSVKDPSTYYGHFGTTTGVNNYYLIRFDLGLIPPSSNIVSANFGLGTAAWYTTGDTLQVRRILDPDGLAAQCASCNQTGWSTLGTVNAAVLRKGATAAFRNHTGAGAGTQWRASDPNTDTDNILNSLDPPEDPKIVSASYALYTFNARATVQSWVSGTAPNQGFAVYATNPSVNPNGGLYPILHPSNRIQLSVAFTPPDGTDAQPPETITDFSVSCVALICTLQWTAPRDPNSAVAEYDIRYSTDPITDANFLAATPITTAPINGIIPPPAAPGGSQTMTVTLTEGFTFYFAIRSRDSLLNWSPASNGTFVTTPNSRGILMTHPRMLLNTSIADTWDPSTNRLAAIIQRVRSGEPATDLARLRTLADALGNCTRDAGGHTVSCASANIAVATDNAGFLSLTIPGFLYQVYTGLGDAVTANTYADLVIDKGILTPLACWNNVAGACDVGTDAAALGAEGAAVAADWVWPRILERGLRSQVIASLKRIWQVHFTDAAFATSLREADFHNYSVGWWSAWLACGIALYGEDPAAVALLNKAWGIIDEGYQMVPMESGEAFTYNLKQSISQLTGGAMNWEGPQYWRSAVPEIVRAIEAYDTATGRSHNVWPTDFPDAYRAGLYKIYAQQPDGNFPGIGDASTGNPPAGRDNYAMAILLDRFKDRTEAGYFKRYIDTLNSWDAGSGGELGLMLKLIFYPYSGVTAQLYTNLPLANRFGNDIIVRTGWTAGDSFFAMQAGYSGAYHRGMEQGAFHLFGGGAALLLKGGPYATSTGSYYNSYFRRTIGSNGGLLIYDSSECWRDNTMNCTLANDGGQRWPWRRHNPPYSTWEFYVNHLWSATLLNSNNYANYPEQYDVAPTGLQSGTGFAYMKADLTKAYANQYSRDSDKPPTSSNHNTNKRVSLVTRDTIVFTQTGDVVMFDRISATHSSFEKRLVLHTTNAPLLGGVQTTAGDNTYTNGTSITADTQNGRLFAQILLPVSPKVRVVGGSTCQTVAITSITSANPAVVTTAIPHGLTTGEVVGITFNTIYGSWALIGANSGSSTIGLTADVVDAFTFRIKKTDGTLLSTAGYPQPAPDPQLAWHDKCGYEGLVDDVPDPTDPTGAARISKNVWIPQATYVGFANSPKFRIEVRPSVQQADDNFLMLYRPTKTSVSIGPTTTLIDSKDFYGAIIDGSEVAIFKKSAGVSLESSSYTATYQGAASHVVSGLAPGRLYRVRQDETVIGDFMAGEQGAIDFSSAGGGVFTVTALGTRGPWRGRIAIGGTTVIR